MKQIRWHLFTVLLSLALLIAACGGAAAPTATPMAEAPAATEPPAAMAEPTATTAAAATGSQTALQLLGWASSEAENTRLSQVVSTFSEQDEQFDATFNPVPEYDAALQNALAATPPDVFYVNADGFPNLASQGALASAGDIIEDPDDFYQPMLQAFTWTDGKLYGVPKDFSVLAMPYNTTMFEAAGISAPPTTWDELRDTLQKLKDAGQPPACIATTIDRWGVFALQAGGSFLSDDRATATFNSDAMKEGLNFFADLVNAGLALPPGQLDSGWCGEAFGKERASVTIEGNWMVPFMKDSFPDVKYEVAPLPAGPAGQGTWAFTAAYGYSPRSANPEGSRALIEYLTSKEGMAEWTGLGLAMPTRQSLAADWAKKFPELDAFITSAEFASVRPSAVGFPDVIRELEAQVDAVIAGTQTPEGALDQVQQIAEQTLERNR